MTKSNYHDKDYGHDLTSDQIDQRNTLIENYTPLVKSVAYTRDRDYETWYTRDDLISVGYEALCTAATKHVRRAQRNAILKLQNPVDFSVYANSYLSGAMKNFVNNESQLSVGVNNNEPLGDYDAPNADIEDDPSELSETCKVELNDYLERLTPKQHFVVVMLGTSGWTQDKIADYMGISQQTVQGHYKAGLVALRQHMEDNGINSADYFLD